MCILTPIKLCLPWTIFQKHRFPCHYVSCGKEKANNVLNTLRRLPDLNLGPFFLFWTSGLKCKNQVKVSPEIVKFQACFYQQFTDDMAFSKWSHWAQGGKDNWINVDCINFGPTSRDMEIRAKFPQEGKISVLFLSKFHWK